MVKCEQKLVLSVSLQLCVPDARKNCLSPTKYNRGAKRRQVGVDAWQHEVVGAEAASTVRAFFTMSLITCI